MIAIFKSPNKSMQVRQEKEKRIDLEKQWNLRWLDWPTAQCIRNKIVDNEVSFIAKCKQETIFLIIGTLISLQHWNNFNA